MLNTTCPSCSSQKFVLIRRLKKYNQIFYLIKCKYCAIVFMSPIPRTDEIKAFYENDQLRNSTYYTLTADDDRKTFNIYFDIISKYKQKGKILDIGCSVGTLLNVSEQRGFTSQTGVELNVIVYKICKKNYPKYTILHKLPTNSTFDVIIMSDVLEHLQNPFTYLQELRTLLNKDGLLFIITPDYDIFCTRYITNVKPIEHIYYFTKQTLTAALLKASYVPLHIANIVREQHITSLLQSSTSENKLLKKILQLILFFHMDKLIENLFIKHLKHNIVAMVKK